MTTHTHTELHESLALEELKQSLEGLESTPPPTPEIERKLGAGSVCEILGITGRKGQVGLYKEKIGEPILPPMSVEEKRNYEFKKSLRPQIINEMGKRIAELLQEEGEPKEVTVRRTDKLRQHPTIEYLVGSAHGTCKIDGKKGLLLAYTCSERTRNTRDSWNQRKLECNMKMQHNLNCYDLEYGYVGMLVGNYHVEVWKVERDEKLINLIEVACKEFWGYVERREVPPLDGKKASELYLKSLYPKATPKKEVKLDVSMYGGLLDRLDELKEQMKPLEDEEKTIQNRLKDAMQEAEVGYVGNRPIKWSNVKSKRFNSKRFKEDNETMYNQYVEETESRRFTVGKPI